MYVSPSPGRACVQVPLALLITPFSSVQILIWLGCVDASPFTAHYNLKKGHSIFIYVGGEKEQLMSESGHHRIYLKERKGFVKLALQYGADLIPMVCHRSASSHGRPLQYSKALCLMHVQYAFGENEAYTTSNAFLGFRKWLQKNLSLGIPICYGRWGTFIPHKQRIALEVRR